MRVLKEIVTPNCKVTIYHWNNKYLLKLETPMLEQTFKVSQFDVTGDEDIVKLLSAEFVEKAVKRFVEMGNDLDTAMAAL